MEDFNWFCPRCLLETLPYCSVLTPSFSSDSDLCSKVQDQDHSYHLFIRA